MIGLRSLSSIAGVVTILAALTACSTGGPPTSPAGNTVGNNSIGTENTGGQNNNGTPNQGSNNQGSSNGSTAGTTANSGSNGSGNSGSSSGNSGSSGNTIDIPSTAAGKTYSVQCGNGDTVSLANAGQVTLTITGHCGELDVNSGQNQVTVDTVDRVVFNGSGNNVFYHCGNPQVTKNGNGNAISQQTGSCGSSGGSGGSNNGASGSGSNGSGASGGEINIAQTGSTESDVCNTSKVNIVANDAHVTLTGHCASIEIFASGTQVTVDSVDTVAITGNNNDVTYHAGNPDVSKLGNGNNVHQG